MDQPEVKRSGFRRALAFAPFALPILLGVGGRIAKRAWPLNDFDAVACAAWRSAHHLPLYAQGLSCPGGHPAAYVYLPQLAWLLAPLAHGPTVTGARIAYGLVYVAIVAALIWAVALRRSPAAPRGLRFAGLALVTGGSLTCGNLAAPCHALVLGAGLTAKRSVWPLAFAIVLVSLIKPVLLTYLLIFAYQPEPWPTRARRIGFALLLAALAAAVVWTTGGESLIAWRAALTHTVIETQTGVGFLDLAARLGFRGNELGVQAVFVVFAGLMSLAGLAIAEGRALSREARLYLAIGLAQLVDPRLMDYDLIMLAPAMAVLAVNAPPVWRSRLGRGLLTILSLSVALNLAERTRLEIRLAPVLLTLFVLVCAGLALSARRYPRGGSRNPRGRSASMVRTSTLPSEPRLTTSQPSAASSWIFWRQPPQGQMRPGSDEVT